MTDTLDRIIYESATGDDQLVPLAFSSDLTSEDADQWRSLIELSAYPPSAKTQARTVGIFPGPGRSFLLATAYAAADESDREIYQVVLLPRKVLHQTAGNLDPLLALTLDSEPLTQTKTDTTIVEALQLPMLLPWQPEDRLKHFRALLQDYAQGNIERVFRMLGALLDERRLLIRDCDEETRARIGLLQGLMALLPAAARAELTFATYAKLPAPTNIMVVFADDEATTRRWVADSAGARFPDARALKIPYIQLLRDLWDGDENAFLDILDEMEPMAEALLPGDTLNAGLSKVADQIRLDHRVRAGKPVEAESLKAVLVNDLPVSGELRQKYAKRLLEHALETRDTEAALLVALTMDEDEALDAALSTSLNDSLKAQPDAVYLFVRTRLNDAMEASHVWIERLQTAALISLQVAISDADSETIINWLRLIAREPDEYGLAQILRDGILATKQRAHDDGELGRWLVMLAIRHVPETVDTLLADQAFLKALPDNLGLVLRDHAGDPLVTLQQRGAELFLVAIARSSEAQKGGNFSSEVIDQVWKLYNSGQSINLPDHYQPDHIVEQWVTSGSTWLPAELLNYLATLILADSQDELFLRLVEHLEDRELLTALLVSALQDSQRNTEDIIRLLGQIVNAEHLSHSEVVRIYIGLLEQREWRQAAFPLVEQLARMIQQLPDLEISTETIWRLLEVATASRSEMVARIATQQLCALLGQEDETDDDELIDMLLQILEMLQWSDNVRQYIMKWWRQFVRQQSVARLSRLEKKMEGKKPLTQCRNVARTTLGFRHMLSNRTIEEFATALNTVFSVLEDISESFDPSPRNPTSFDEETIREELDAQHDGISETRVANSWQRTCANWGPLSAKWAIIVAEATWCARISTACCWPENSNRRVLSTR